MYILTDGVANFEPLLGGPVIVDFGVIGRGNNPAVVVPNFEFKGRNLLH